jgi:predicted membrane channel-forming protein YqfA (hemolysin III family)
MATFLDVTGLEAFSKIFIFVLVLLAVYAVFAYSKAFGGTKWIAWLIALVVAIFVILSDLASGLIKNLAPWFAVLFIFVVFISVASKIFGAGAADFEEYKWVIVVIMVLVFFVGALFYIRNNVNVPNDIDEDGNEIGDDNYVSTTNFIFHPKVMGIIFVLLVLEKNKL